MRAVIDASLAFAWVSDEVVTDAVTRLLEDVVVQGALAPPLFRLEIANALITSERRGKISHATRVAMLADLQALPIAIDPEPIEMCWRRALDLAEAFDLTVYDATYLELAQRSGLPLATLDAALIRAAPACGVDIA
jgi:predicted nucleic acid-binding protein